jgi:hypothetical protein
MTTQHTYTYTKTNIYSYSGIRTHDPSNQAAKTYASDRAATGIGSYTYNNRKIIIFCSMMGIPKFLCFLKRKIQEERQIYLLFIIAYFVGQWTHAFVKKKQ